MARLLAHAPYIRTLPAPERLRTPLHFTERELELFGGTNLYGATLDRRQEWRDEWSVCCAAFDGECATLRQMA